MYYFKVSISASTSHSLSKYHSQTALKGVKNSLVAVLLEEILLALDQGFPKFPLWGNFINEFGKPCSSRLSNVLHIIYSADILWGLKMVKFNFLEQSCYNKFKLFQDMFPYSGIAKTSSMQATKYVYTIN